MERLVDARNEQVKGDDVEVIKRTNGKKINSSQTEESEEENLQASSCVRSRHALTRERDKEGINK